MSKGITITAVHLASAGNQLRVEIEHDGEWVTVITETGVCEAGHQILPISHICEESGLRNAVSVAAADRGHQGELA